MGVRVRNPERARIVEVPSRYKGMSRCATRYVEWSPDRQAWPGRTFACLELKNEASLHAYSTIHPAGIRLPLHASRPT